MKLWNKIPKRGRHITQEPANIAPDLLGTSLATFRRRAVAFLLDIILFGLLVGATFTFLTAWSFHRDDPTLFSRLRASETTDLQKRQAIVDFLYFAQERCPEMLDHDMRDAVRQRDPSGLKEFWDDDKETTVGFGSDPTELREVGDQYVLQIGTDLLFGGSSSIFSWGAFFVGWFTIWMRLTRGRTPGKFLWRLRVVRLDGKNLRWWDCFSRSGGYSASTATIMLGFLESIWDPNRQAIHDKIAGTVVVRNYGKPQKNS